MNFNEVQKFLAPTNHVLYTNQLAMNKKAYESLDPAYQKALNQAVSEALKELAPKLGEIDKQNKETLEKKGMTIIKYDSLSMIRFLPLILLKRSTRISTARLMALVMSSCRNWMPLRKSK